MTTTTETTTAAPEIAAYYEGLGRKVLKARHCRDCGKHSFPPTGCCPHCGSARVDWTELSGRGQLLFATNNIAPACHPRFNELAPYVYGHVRLDEGITVQAIVRGVQPTVDALRALYERAPVPVVADVMQTPDLPVLVFRLA